jgi:hypothetical protein
MIPAVSQVIPAVTKMTPAFIQMTPARGKNARLLHPGVPCGLADEPWRAREHGGRLNPNWKSAFADLKGRLG